MSEKTSSEAPTESTPPAAMAGTTLPDATGVTDPTALADHPAVEFRERTFTHESPEHCEHGTRGRAIVGVTDADGSVLLCVRDGGDHAVLPNDVVDGDDEWTTAARETVEDGLGVAVELDGPVRVCRVDHHLEDDTHAESSHDAENTHDVENTHHLETTHHVVFRGSHPSDGDRDDPAITCDDDWQAVWTDHLPDGLDQVDGSVLDDVRLFLDPDGEPATATERDSATDA